MSMIFAFRKYDIVIDTEEYFRISSLVALWVWKNSAGYSNIWYRKIAYTQPMYYVPDEHNLINCLSLLKWFWVSITRPQNMESLRYSDANRKKAEDFLSQYTGRTKICMHTGWAETSPERFWSQSNWIELIKKIIDTQWEKVVIFLSGTKFEENNVREIIRALWDKYWHLVINLCWMFGLFDFAAVLERIDLMISNDTGPMHLAAAMWTKTIWLFGPNLPNRFGPYPLDKNVALYKGDGKCVILPEEWVFGEDDSNSIDKISVDDVYISLSI